MSTQIPLKQDPSLTKCLLGFWRGFVNYQKQTGRKEFWIGMLEGWGLILLVNQFIFEYFAVAYAGGASGKIVLTVQVIFTLVMLIALTALVFRRLRDVGLKTLPITVLVVCNVLLFLLKVFYASTILAAGFVILMGLMFLLFLMPANAMTLDKANILFRQKKR